MACKRLCASVLLLIGGFNLVVGARSARAGENFSLTVTPYAWFAGIDGTVGVKGLKTDIDESFTELLDKTDTLVGLFGRVEARTGPFGFYVDGGYIKLGVDNVSTSGGFGNADITQEIGIIDFGLVYRLLDLPKGGGEEATRFTLDATVGARYWTMGLEINPDNFASRDGGQAWIDPTVGARATVTFARHWQILIGGDVGGFGAASQFTWSAVGTVGYVFHIGSVESSVFAGYKAIADDYANGGFTWDATMSGPVVGMSFTF